MSAYLSYRLAFQTHFIQTGRKGQAAQSTIEDAASSSFAAQIGSVMGNPDYYGFVTIGAPVTSFAIDGIVIDACGMIAIAASSMSSMRASTCSTDAAGLSM